MRKLDPVSIDIIRELLHYDPETGVFRWKNRRANIPAGTEAGYINFWGYRIIGIITNGKKTRYSAHRLAWAYVTGKWPVNEIDHKNMNKADNKWGNLREATSSQNKCNRVEPNQSGFKGVFKKESWRKKPWAAQICINKKRVCLGNFLTPEEAYAAYCDAVVKYHGDFARVA